SRPAAAVPAELGEALPAEAEAVEAAMGEEGDRVSARLARGCRCFAAWRGRQVLAYGWLSTDAEWIGEIGLEIRPAPGEGYVWNCVTLPAHRRSGLFRALLVAVAAEAKREGLSRLWIASVEDATERPVVAAGFEPVLRVRALPLPGLRWLTAA